MITYKGMRERFARPRRADAHKGDFGHVLVCAGGRGMAGAAILCARGALRAGSGLVTVSVDEALSPIIQAAVPEAMCVGRELSAALSEGALAKYGAICCGPGIGTDAAARAMVRHLASSFDGPIVLDADALNIIAAGREGDAAGAYFRHPHMLVLTPHPGEAARLLGSPWTAAAVQGNREEALLALAGKYGCTVVLKGAGTLVAGAGANVGGGVVGNFSSESPRANAPAQMGETLRIRQNTTGNPGMATGGSGDVLAGVIASLLGQGMGPADAAAAGVYIHGLAGDIMAGTYGEAGLTAGDIADGIALAIRKLATERSLP